MKIKVEQAAKLLGKSPYFVRCGIITGKLPIGTAIQLTGKSYSYYVSPGLLATQLGVTVEKLEEML